MADKTVVLSGGDFGGTQVSVPDDDAEIRMPDERGNVWVYDHKIHDGDGTAHFVRMETAQ